MASPTPNKGYTYPAHGGAVNAWDTPLNTNFDQIDLNVGGYYPVTITSTATTVTYNSSGAIASSTAATITPPSSLAQNLNYVFSGTLTQNVKLVLPTAGGFYVVNNGTTGSFSLTVGQAAGTAVTISQGGTNVLTTNGTDTVLADSNPAAAKFYSYLGNPNGSVAGSVGSVNGALSDSIWDVTNRQLYLVTTGSSLAASTVWSPQIPRIEPEGILTLNNSTTTPLVTSDTTGSSIYYTPYRGNWTVLSNGTILFPYQFSQMTLSLTASQAANQIYDIFMFYNSGTPVIGTGPAWATATAGSGSRGSGAGTTQLTRLQGVLVNAVQVTLTNGASTYVCAASNGIYLGSIFVDSSAGSVSCYTSWGASRKWGVWNNYNRNRITLVSGISTASWTYSSTTWRRSNADSTATMATFMGITEEPVQIIWDQMAEGDTGSAIAAFNTIALNSATTPTYFTPNPFVNISGADFRSCLSGNASAVLAIGVNNLNWLEKCSISNDVIFYGTISSMTATATYTA